MIKILSKVHKKLLLNIIINKLENPNEWIVDQRRYYTKFVYDGEDCYIFILYSKIYNRIEFYNKIKNKYMVYSISYFDKFKLRKKLNELLENKKFEDIESILNLEDQESENGVIE